MNFLKNLKETVNLNKLPSMQRVKRPYYDADLLSHQKVTFAIRVNDSKLRTSHLQGQGQ